ncbi:hypothetical protein [Sinorhizobium fredii]|uniref:hypothetical protein n=1 Tax=Rhizobium fredii TaxID=380 RepID=UPI003511EE6F
MQDQLGSAVNFARDFLNQGMLLGLLVGVSVGLLAYFAASKILGRGRPSKGKSAIERQFRNVFAIMMKAADSL